MKSRRKTDLSTAIVWDGQTRTNWITAQYTVPAIEGMPEEVYEQYLKRAVRELDTMLGDAMVDAMLAGWVALPPVQAREHDRLGFGFPEVNRHYIERRVRVEQPQVRNYSYGSWAVARLEYTFEPQDYRGDSLAHPWSTYEPEYEEEAKT